jgi:hypothetical protein
VTARVSGVRPATRDDIAGFVQLGLRFYREEGGREADPLQLAHFASSHLGEAHRAFFVAERGSSPPRGSSDREREQGTSGVQRTCMVGFLCALVAPHYLTGEPTAFKTAWYVVPGARGYGALLLRTFEAWAQAKAARRIIVAGRADRTLKLLARRNFFPLETVYAKEIPWQKQPFPSS